MPIEHFTKEEFEAALPKDKNGTQLWSYEGIDAGEHIYIIRVTNKISIFIRSSVWDNGKSAESGEDSIRAWLVDNNMGPLSVKTQRWVTRLPNWEIRLVDMLRTLYAWGLKSNICPHCGKPRHIYKVHKKGPNYGRIFAKCADQFNCVAAGTFIWLTEPESPPTNTIKTYGTTKKEFLKYVDKNTKEQV